MFCWTFIPAIIAFIECIIFLLMSDEDFNRKYGENTPNSTTPQINKIEELEKLHTLKEKGAISQEEYNQKKSELL